MEEITNDCFPLYQNYYTDFFENVIFAFLIIKADVTKLCRELQVHVTKSEGDSLEGSEWRRLA